jgi:hypothetical protein
MVFVRNKDIGIYVANFYTTFYVSAAHFSFHLYILWNTLFLVAPTLEHRAPMKCFVSLQFLNPKTIDRTLWTGDQPIARPLPSQDNTNTE